MNKSDEDLIDRWCAALRSGEYEQSQGTLFRKIGDQVSMGLATPQYAYCCLGVLYVVAGLPITPVPKATKGVTESGANDVLSDDDMRRIGVCLGEGWQPNLAAANDGGASFPQIADYIELVKPHLGGIYDRHKDGYWDPITKLFVGGSTTGLFGH